MSEIATLENLELHLAQVVPAAPSAPAKQPIAQAPSVMANGRQGSHLELFFSEVQYSTFVPRKKLDPKVRQAKTSSTSGEGRLTYNPRLS